MIAPGAHLLAQIRPSTRRRRLTRASLAAQLTGPGSACGSGRSRPRRRVGGLRQTARDAVEEEQKVRQDRQDGHAHHGKQRTVFAVSAGTGSDEVLKKPRLDPAGRIAWRGAELGDAIPRRHVRLSQFVGTPHSRLLAGTPDRASVQPPHAAERSQGRVWDVSGSAGSDNTDSAN